MKKSPNPNPTTCEQCGATLQQQGPIARCARCLSEYPVENPRPERKPR